MPDEDRCYGDEPPYQGSLVAERDSWREWILQDKPLASAEMMLDTYKSWRGSEYERSSRMVEQLCEMVLVYREQLKEKKDNASN